MRTFLEEEFSHLEKKVQNFKITSDDDLSNKSSLIEDNFEIIYEKV
jgi:hypothetical protein